MWGKLTRMATTLSPRTDDSAPPKAPRSKVSLWVIIPALVVAQIVVMVVLVNIRRGAIAARITNSAVQGAPRPVEFLFGKSDWIVMQEAGLVAMLVILVAIGAVFWQRYPRHPVLLMALAATGLVWLDPVMNWAPYAVYNPQLTHWPETWPLVSLAPTVEPFIVLGYATFYVATFFPAVWILRRIQARRAVDSFAWRHPLISLAGIIFVLGFVYDAILEIFCVRTGLYIYSQVIPFGSIWAGKSYQFPLIWEASLVTLVMIPAGVLLYQDDTGKTQAEKLAQRIRMFRGRPALGNVRRHVRHPQRGVLLLRRGVRGDPDQRRGDVGRVSVAVSRSEGVRPAGLLRKGGGAGSILPGYLVRMAIWAAGRTSRCHTAGRRRPVRAQEGLTMKEARVLVDGTRKTEILDTAATMFASHGVRTSLQEIADAAGILPGSLYHHFDSKEAIIIELIERYQADLDQIAAQAVADLAQPGSGREKIVALADAIASCAVRHRAALLLTFYEPPATASEEFVRLTRRTPDAIEHAMTETLRAARASGDLRANVDLRSVRGPDLSEHVAHRHRRIASDLRAASRLPGCAARFCSTVSRCDRPPMRR